MYPCSCGCKRSCLLAKGHPHRSLAPPSTRSSHPWGRTKVCVGALPLRLLSTPRLNNYSLALLHAYLARLLAGYTPPNRLTSSAMVRGDSILSSTASAPALRI